MPWRRRSDAAAVWQLRGSCRAFGQRRVTIPAPRACALRPAIYNANMPRLGERITGLATGLNKNDGSNFKDFSAGYFLDEAAAASVLGNAKKIAEVLTAPTSRDRSLKVLVTETPPTQQQVTDGIQTLFARSWARRSARSRNVWAFHKASSNTGGHGWAKALLTAILLQPEVLYRGTRHGRAGRTRSRAVELARDGLRVVVRTG